jgi:hypothetical protein
MADYPKPNAGGWTSSNYNTPGSGLLYNNYSANLPIHDDTWQWDQRLDFNISQKDQTYARYSYMHDQVGFAPPLGPILDGGNNIHVFRGHTDMNLGQSFMASETHLFNPKLINEFRFGYNEGKYEDLQANANVPASTLVPGMGGVPFGGYPQPNGGLPDITLTGTISMSTIGARHDIPSIEHQNVYQILDNVTKAWKSHSVCNLKVFAHPSASPCIRVAITPTKESSPVAITTMESLVHTCLVLDWGRRTCLPTIWVKLVSRRAGIPATTVGIVPRMLRMTGSSTPS